MLFSIRNVFKNQKFSKHASKCENKKRLKDILEAAMVSTPEVFIDHSSRYIMTPTPVKK